MTTPFGDGVRGIFERSKSEVTRIEADKFLSSEGKAAKSREVRQAAVSQARDIAAAELATRRTQVARAGERHSEAVRRERQREDPVRATLALQRAQIVAQNASWEQVQQGIEGALAMGDPYDLRAWSDLMPVVHKRFDSDNQKGMQVIGAHRKVFDALEAQESPDVRAARVALETAEGELQAVYDDMDLLLFEADFNYDRLQVNALKEAVTGPPAGPVSVPTDEFGGFYITSGDAGRGWL